jgi:hypothetical protein
MEAPAKEKTRPEGADLSSKIGHREFIFFSVGKYTGFHSILFKGNGFFSIGDGVGESPKRITPARILSVRMNSIETIDALICLWL